MSFSSSRWARWTALAALAGAPVLAAAQDRGSRLRETEAAARQELGWWYEGESHALLVGVSDYTAGWPDLESVPGELEEVAEALEAQGFAVESVRDPTGEELRAAFRSFIDRHGFEPRNRLLFFFAGHGYTRQEGLKGYLVGADAPDPRRREREFLLKSLPMSQILAWAREIEARHALFLFDSCFSGTVFKARALPELPPLISAATAEPVRQFITAGSAGEEVPARSVFAPSFVRALEGGGDLNQDGYVSGTELGMHLTERVLDYRRGQTPQYGKIRDPDLDRGDFVFRVSVAPAQVAQPAVADAPMPSLPEPLGEPTIPGASPEPAWFRSIDLQGAPGWVEDQRLNRRIFLPGGAFWMGSAEGEGDESERPRHRVRLSPFYIQEHEVTNEEYRRFDSAHEFPAGEERHPVVDVGWDEARAYALWLGGDLPTEAQWEFAARGEEGRKYPWGEAAPTCELANFSGCSGRTLAVGSHPGGATPDGLHDLAGNVWEWCRDWYGPYPATEQEDPVGPGASRGRVLRAFDITADDLRAAYRIHRPPEHRSAYIGFRVVWSSSPGPD